MKALKYKKGSIILYSLLLVLAVAVMYSLKNCNDKYYSVQKIGGSSGDTLDVAIVYSMMTQSEDLIMICSSNLLMTKK